MERKRNRWNESDKNHTSEWKVIWNKERMTFVWTLTSMWTFVPALEDHSTLLMVLQHSFIISLKSSSFPFLSLTLLSFSSLPSYRHVICHQVCCRSHFITEEGEKNWWNKERKGKRQLKRRSEGEREGEKRRRGRLEKWKGARKPLTCVSRTCDPWYGFEHWTLLWKEEKNEEKWRKEKQLRKNELIIYGSSHPFSFPFSPLLFYLSLFVPSSSSILSLSHLLFSLSLIFYLLVQFSHLLDFVPCQFPSVHFNHSNTSTISTNLLLALEEWKF